MLDANVTEFMICVYDMLAVVVLSIHPSRHPSRHPSIQVPHPGKRKLWKGRTTTTNGGNINLSKCLCDFSLVKIGCY
jgi:hypothetical protein